MVLKTSPRPIWIQLGSFALVGTLGFVIESCTILALIAFFQTSPVLSKFIAFPIAVLVTWALNRRITFIPPIGARLIPQLFRYFQTAIGGMCINLLAFFTVLTINPNSNIVIVCATASGSLAGLLVNYLGCNHFVFSANKADPK
jgi:putative flippase GtrA